MAKPSLPFVRSPYNYDTMAASDESALTCLDPSLAIQSAKDECDINIMLERMSRGILPDISNLTPLFGDFTNSANDYHDALNTVIAAQEAFFELPANLRSRFDNDPEKLLAFLGDSSNRAEAMKLGLLSPTEDLSTATPQRAQDASDGGAVEKSGQQA